MSEFQVITVLTTLVGLVATVLNLVAFVHEKDKSHVKAGLRVLLAMSICLALLFFPRWAPATAQQIAAVAPTSLSGWLHPSPAPAPMVSPSPSPSPSATPLPLLQGSFTLDLRRNLLGGIDSLMAHFQFSNLSAETVKITAYQIRYLDHQGQSSHRFYRVLAEPIVVSGNGNVVQEVELDAEIRDVWVAGLERPESERDRMEITWEGVDGQGQRFQLATVNG